MDDQPATMALRCPHCGRGLRKAWFTTQATLVLRRTCPRCRTRWQVIAKPIKPVAQGFAHRLEWLSRGAAGEAS